MTCQLLIGGSARRVFHQSRQTNAAQREGMGSRTTEPSFVCVLDFHVRAMSKHAETNFDHQRDQRIMCPIRLKPPKKCCTCSTFSFRNLCHHSCLIKASQSFASMPAVGAEGGTERKLTTCRSFAKANCQDDFNCCYV